MQIPPLWSLCRELCKLNANLSPLHGNNARQIRTRTHTQTIYTENVGRAVASNRTPKLPRFRFMVHQIRMNFMNG